MKIDLTKSLNPFLLKIILVNIVFISIVKIGKCQYDTTSMTSDSLKFKKITVKIDTFVFDTIPPNENIETIRVNKQQCKIKLSYPHFDLNKNKSGSKHLNDRINKIIFENKPLLSLCDKGNNYYNIDLKTYYFQKHELIAIAINKQKNFKQVPPHISTKHLHYSFRQNKFLDFNDIFDSNKKESLIKMLSEKCDCNKNRIDVNSFLLTKDDVVFNQEHRLQKAISVEYEPLKEKSILNYAK